MPPEQDLLKKIYELEKDNNRMLRAQRRSAFWGGVFKVVLWVAMLLIPLWIYTTYLAPTLNEAMTTLNSVQGQVQRAQDVGAQITVPFSEFSGILEGLKAYLPEGAAQE